MRWEELNGDRFVSAVAEAARVCLLPLSVIERHGHHLPMGTDMYIGRAICRRAAELEPAIIFPDYIFGQIGEGRHLPGTISMVGDLMLHLLDNVCHEIARNGLKKVVLVNAHGGNQGLVSLFNMLQLNSPRDYVVYVVQPGTLLFEGTVETPWELSSDGHAGPGETSLIQAIRPELVDMEQVPAGDEGRARNRLQALRDTGVQTGMWWYADHPTHYQGDASRSAAEVGERLLEAMAQALARAIRAVKEDTVSPRLLDEFYRTARSPLAQ
jgi:creatinine amidohydrolase